MITRFSPEYQSTCYGCGVEMGGHTDPDATMKDEKGNWWNTNCYQSAIQKIHDQNLQRNNEQDSKTDSRANARNGE